MFAVCQCTDQLPLSLLLYSILMRVHNDLEMTLAFPNIHGFDIVPVEWFEGLNSSGTLWY